MISLVWLPAWFHSQEPAQRWWEHTAGDSMLWGEQAVWGLHQAKEVQWAAPQRAVRLL